MALGVPPYDPASGIPTGPLLAETDRLLAGAAVAPEVRAALRSAAGDFAGMAAVPASHWFVVVGRVRHGGADAHLAALDFRRTVAAAP
ncbi:hypothetical protein [Streptomyces hydrogenans]|uniref:hypothetical protein n=1 Tax=Streptomyces hydrogenans TaxID=1873719 RepID=UPI00380101FF